MIFFVLGWSILEYCECPESERQAYSGGGGLTVVLHTPEIIGCGLVGGVLGVPLTFLAPGYGWRLRVSVRLSLAAIVALGTLDSRPMA